MKTRMTIIAAMAAASLTLGAAPARAEGAPVQESAAREEAPVRLASAEQAEAPAEAEAREREPKKRKSTGDKVLTGVAVVLGVAAIAVGGLLVAIFAN